MTRRARASCAAAVALAALVSAGCAVRLGDMSVITSRNVALDGVNLDTLPQTRNVEGKDMKWILLLIPLGIPHLENAIDDALTKGNGDVMVDAVISNESWWFIVGQSGFKVKGTVAKTRSAAP